MPKVAQAGYQTPGSSQNNGWRAVSKIIQRQARCRASHVADRMTPGQVAKEREEEQGFGGAHDLQQGRVCCSSSCGIDGPRHGRQLWRADRMLRDRNDWPCGRCQDLLL